MTAIVDKEKCTGCCACIESCPLDAIEEDGDIVKIDADVCGDCGACIDVCPVEALSMD